jgi:hypothetical protein
VLDKWSDMLIKVSKNKIKSLREQNKLFILATVVGTDGTFYILSRLENQVIKDSYKELKQDIDGKSTFNLI